MIEQNEMFATLREVIERLDDLTIPYMLTGSFAMGVYVPARTTMDIDIVIEINSDDAKAFEEKFAGAYYVSASSIRRAVTDRSMFNIISNSTFVKVDCILKKADRFETGKFGRRKENYLSGLKVWVIGLEDLILSKLKWARGSFSERQFEDVRKLMEADVDENLIQSQVVEMDLISVWEHFEQWKTQIQK
jgi:predicted nucleotidyltransferase